LIIVSANLERRDLTKSQQAIALAMDLPRSSTGPRQEGPSKKRRRNCGFLDEALKTMEQERRAGQSIDQKMAELRAGAPDIADLVDDERLTPEAGITELRTRQLRIEEGIDAAKRAIERIADVPVQWAMVEKGIALAGVEMLGALDVEAISKPSPL
jgi:hypothetical protein